MAITSKATLPTKSSNKKGPRKTSSLPTETVEYLKAWMMSPEHIAHPYPTEPEKAQIMADTGIELKQLTNWFVNNRKRYWKPRVEARLQQQARAAAAAAQAHAAAVAVANASAAHTNPVSPEQGYKPSLPLPHAGNGFVTFDLGNPSVPTNSTTTTTTTKLPSRRYTHLVDTDMARVMADHTANADRDERIVSENSSSASVTASDEGTISDSATYQEEEEEEEIVQHNSFKTCSPSELDQQQKQQQKQVQHEQMEYEEDYSSEQTTGESSSSVSIASSAPATISLSSFEESAPTTTATKKRVFVAAPTVVTETTEPRKKFRRVSIGLWRETCQKAANVYDDDALPSLEEATQLFGFSH